MERGGLVGVRLWERELGEGENERADPHKEEQALCVPRRTPVVRVWGPSGR